MHSIPTGKGGGGSLIHTYDGIRQGPEPGIGTGGYELGTDGISTDLSNKYR